MIPIKRSNMVGMMKKENRALHPVSLYPDRRRLLQWVYECDFENEEGRLDHTTAVRATFNLPSSQGLL